MDVTAPTLDPGPFREPVAGEPLEARWLGRIAYRDAWTLQHALVERRVAGEIPDQLLLLEHPAVLTLGRNADELHVRASSGQLAARGIELIRVERGGEVTYHGPGQLVAYPILALSRRGLLVRPLVRALEAAMAETCAAFGVAADRRDGHPGCWCDVDTAAPRKIGALGIRVERGVSYHGIALNVDPDLADFDLIDACGMPGVLSTSIAHELAALRTGRGASGAGRSASGAGWGAPRTGRGATRPDPSAPRTGRADGSGGDARLGINGSGPRLPFEIGPGFTSADASSGIAGDPASLRGSVAGARESADHRAGLGSGATGQPPDAPTGIDPAPMHEPFLHETGDSWRDAPTGITVEPLPAGSNVIRAARIFAEALAGHLGAELQGFAGAGGDD